MYRLHSTFEISVCVERKTCYLFWRIYYIYSLFIMYKWRMREYFWNLLDLIKQFMRISFHFWNNYHHNIVNNFIVRCYGRSLAFLLLHRSPTSRWLVAVTERGSVGFAVRQWNWSGKSVTLLRACVCWSRHKKKSIYGLSFHLFGYVQLKGEQVHVDSLLTVVTATTAITATATTAEANANADEEVLGWW